MRKDASLPCRPDAGPNPDITILHLDLASFHSIRDFVAAFKAKLGLANLDFLILNAAVMQTPQWYIQHITLINTETQQQLYTTQRLAAA